MTKIKEHFNFVAKDYDYYKKKNWYYYASLKKTLLELIPSPQKMKILDLGCGTGELLAYLNPKKGIGIDISEAMVVLAKKKNKKYRFIVSSAEKIDKKNVGERVDYIIAVDIIEHLDNVDTTLKRLSEISSKKTTILFIMANPLWEPILLILEKLKLKMPEGPHYRISYAQFKEIIKKNKLIVKERGFRLLLPLKIPLFHRINDFFYKIPLIKNLGLTEYIVIKKY